MISLVIANIGAVIPMSQHTKDIVTTAINAGATATSIIALLGGGALIGYVVKKAFQKKATAVIVAA